MCATNSFLKSLGVDLDGAVLKEPPKGLPAVQGIADRLRRAGFSGYLGLARLQPFM